MAMTATVGLAQSNETATKAENVKPYSVEEETAARKRIEGFEQKINANRDNEKVNYEEELQRLNEMKARFNKRATNKFEMKEEKK